MVQKGNASQVPKRLKIENLMKLEKIRKSSKLNRIITQCPAFLPKQKCCQYYQKTAEK